LIYKIKGKVLEWFNGKKTYIVGTVIAVFGTLMADPNFQALLGSHAGLVTQVLGLLVLWARSQVQPAA